MNTSGRRVLMAYEELTATKPAMDAIEDSSNYESFMQAGEEIVGQLRAVVHGDLHPREVDQGNMRRWLRTAWQALPSAKVAAAMAVADDQTDEGDTEVPLGDPNEGHLEGARGGLADDDGADHDEGSVDDELDQPASAGAPPMSPDAEGPGRFGRYLRRTAGGEWEAQAELVARIEEMLRATGVPWSRDPVPSVFWTLSADVGEVWAMLSEDGQLLTLYQPIHELKPGSDETQYLTALLQQNFNSAGGACFAIRLDEDGSNHVVVVCRLPARTLDQEELETAIENLFHLSSLFDDD